MAWRGLARRDVRDRACRDGLRKQCHEARRKPLMQNDATRWCDKQVHASAFPTRVAHPVESYGALPGKCFVFVSHVFPTVIPVGVAVLALTSVLHTPCFRNPHLEELLGLRALMRYRDGVGCASA